MGLGILSFLNPLKGAFDTVASIVDTLGGSSEEKLAAKGKIREIERGLAGDVLKYESTLAEERASVIRAEVTSQSFMTRNWRPMIMLLFGYIIMHNYVIAQIFGVPYLEITDQMWGLLKLGIGGYIAGRTTEKVLPALAALRKTNGT